LVSRGEGKKKSRGGKKNWDYPLGPDVGREKEEKERERGRGSGFLMDWEEKKKEKKKGRRKTSDASSIDLLKRP